MNTPIKEHPTVAAHRRKLAPEKITEPLDADWLRRLCLDAGADDVGFMEVDTLRRLFRRKCVLGSNCCKSVGSSPPGLG